MFYCELCENKTEYFNLFPQEPITKRQAERKARKDGWTKLSAIGWVHKPCLKEAADQ
jgi:hypothetical protein